MVYNKLMRSGLVIFILLALVSCTSLKSKFDSSIQYYVNYFERSFDHKVTVPITFGDLPDNVVGMCYFFKGPKPLRFIILDSGYWEKSAVWERELLVFHELGHCEFDLEHDNTVIPGVFTYQPGSMMFPYLFWEYSKERSFYIDELRKKRAGF